MSPRYVLLGQPRLKRTLPVWLRCLRCESDLTVFTLREQDGTMNTVLGCFCCNFVTMSGCRH